MSPVERTTGKIKLQDADPDFQKEEDRKQVLEIKHGYVTFDPTLKPWLENAFRHQLSNWALSMREVVVDKKPLTVVVQQGQPIKIETDEKYHEGVRAQTENFLKKLNEVLAALKK